MTRPSDALVWTFLPPRMRVHKEGGWIKRTDYESWRDYALALESKLRQEERKG